MPVPCTSPAHPRQLRFFGRGRIRPQKTPTNPHSVPILYPPNPRKNPSRETCLSEPLWAVDGMSMASSHHTCLTGSSAQYVAMRWCHPHTCWKCKQLEGFLQYIWCLLLTLGMTHAALLCGRPPADLFYTHLRPQQSLS